MPSAISDGDNLSIDVLWQGSNRPNLKQQPPRVYRVALSAMRECELNTLLCNAFPDEDPSFARRILIKHAQKVGYKDMVRKLKSDKGTDETYQRKFGQIVSCSLSVPTAYLVFRQPGHRVNLIRSKVKKACQLPVKTVYRLKPGAKDLIEFLHEGIAYIYPYDYEVCTSAHHDVDVH